MKINEPLCIGCGLCVKKCPYNCIKLVKIPKNLPQKTLYRYGENQFVIYGIPFPRINKVLGIIGVNGIGKSTALKLLTKQLVINFGDKENYD